MFAISPTKYQPPIEFSQHDIIEQTLKQIHTFLKNNPYSRTLQTYPFNKLMPTHYIPSWLHKELLEMKEYLNYIYSVELNYNFEDALIIALQETIPHHIIMLNQNLIPTKLVLLATTTDSQYLYNHCQHYHPWVRTTAAANSYCPDTGKVLVQLLNI